MDKPVLSKQAFWDVDTDKIDYEKNARHVIETVINGDNFKDFIAIRNFYNDEKIKQEIIYSKELGPKEINFCCLILISNPGILNIRQIGLHIPHHGIIQVLNPFQNLKNIHLQKI